MRWLLALALALPAVAGARSEAVVTPLKMIDYEVDAQAREGKQPVVVFDLDATLFDNRPRTLAILRAWAALPENAGKASAQRIEGLAVAQVAYAVKDTLAAAGVTDGADIEAITAFWWARFFGPWALHDGPMPGGPAYVNALYAKGAFIVYLTGRDAPSMLVPTTQSLALAGYPIGLPRTQLIMKPDPKADDEVFKDSVMRSLRLTGSVVGFFDNEPGNVNLMKKAFPKARVVFLDTMHKPGAPAVDAGIPRVKDFVDR
ncbi:MAG: haloacid dehalogenase-like hydrolase [Myxococcales bacterium]|nr:haloacid dehalogenase-like hydrolase [Myxococcales bacterium]